MRNSLKLLVATTALIGVTQLAHATSANTIYIDATDNSGSVSSIAIVQDSTGSGNVVASTGAGTAALPIAGAMGNVSITQTGSGNVLSGGIKVAPSSGTAGDLTASYTSGSNGTNTDSLTIGSSHKPTSVGGASYSGGNSGSWTTTGPLSITMDATSGSATGNNAVTDALDATGALNYTLNVAGSANTIGNTLSGSSIKLNVNATGDSNTVANSITGAGAIALDVAMTGGGGSNSVTTNSTGGGAKTVVVQLASSGNTVDNELGSGGGAQTSTLVADSTSKVNYLLTQTTSGGGATANVTLNGAAGTSGVNNGQADITVAQGDSATANLTLYGGGYAMGPTAYGSSTYTGGLTSDGAAGGQYAVVVSQSAGAVLNATVTSNAAGFTAVFKQ
ncbi:MAG: hypothetical protein P4L66_13225 [Acetobacteraceae bacterium]|nr:hypothetical protein [Acetobacteraceae bacterium]